MKHIGALVLAALLAPLTLLPAVTVEDLRCEYRENPLGIDVVKPRLSWKIEERAEGENLKPEFCSCGSAERRYNRSFASAMNCSSDNSSPRAVAGIFSFSNAASKRSASKPD